MYEKPPAEIFDPAVIDPPRQNWTQPDYGHMALMPSHLELHSRDCVRLGPSEYDVDESLRLTIRGMRGVGWIGIFGTAAGLLGEVTKPENEGRVGISGVVALGLSTLFTIGLHMFERQKKQPSSIHVKEDLR